jgi:hypothetical protein
MSAATTGLTAVAALEGAWLVAATYVAAAYHPRHPHATAPHTELGIEPPAVVNLLTHGWEVTSEAVPATLLDLAARRLVEIIQVSPEEEIVQLRSKADTANLVNAYEKQVLDHLRKVSVGGVVPARALTTGPKAVSKNWWTRFRREVVNDARRRNLSRPRYPAAVLTALGLAIPIFLVLIVAVLKATDWSSSDTADPAWWAVGASFVGLAACFVTMSKFDRNAQRDTPLGREVAGQWLGVHDAYASSDYDELPPGAVVLYERHLAYAAAMSTARLAVARLPLGAENDRHAWSSFGGQWRQVEVHYPRRRAAWGFSPLRAILTGLLWTALLIIPFYVTARWGADLYTSIRDGIDGLRTADDPANPLDERKLHWLALGITAVAAVALTIAALEGIYRGVLPLVRGLLDLGSRRTVRGLVVRRRDLARTQNDRVVVDHFAAVDDGTASKLDAWKLKPEQALLFDQGDEIEVVVTKHLGHVSKLRDLSKARPLPPPVPPKGLAPPAVPAATIVNDRRATRRSAPR